MIIANEFEASIPGTDWVKDFAPDAIFAVYAPLPIYWCVRTNKSAVVIAEIDDQPAAPIPALKPESHG